MVEILVGRALRDTVTNTTQRTDGSSAASEARTQNGAP